MTLELAVASEDLPDCAVLLEERWRSTLNADQAAGAELVVDFDAEETTCPACLTTFAPEIPMCPGCGLRFG